MAKRRSNVGQLVKELANLRSEHADLVAQRAEIDERLVELAPLFDKPETSKKPVRKKSVKKKSVKKKSKAKRSHGPKPDDILVKFSLPASDQDPQDRETIFQSMSKKGFATSSAKPLIVVGQALGRLKKAKLATNSGHGLWQLTKKGDAKRGEMSGNAEPVKKTTKKKSSKKAAPKAEDKA